MAALKNLTAKLVKSISLTEKIDADLHSKKEHRTPSIQASTIPLPVPYEIQSLILSHLPLSDIFTLRLVSMSLYGIIQSHQSSISRQLWPRLPPSVIPCQCAVPPSSFSPGPDQLQPTLNDLFTAHHRSSIESKLAATLTDLVYSKFLRIEIRPGVARLDAMRFRLFSRIRLALRHLEHFLITYRALSLDGTSHGQPSTTEPDINLQLSILKPYSTPCLVELHAVSNILHTTLSMKLRPPSYATMFERVVRRWTKDPAASTAISKLVLCGGLEGVDFILKLKPYAVRIEALRRYTEALKHRDLLPHDIPKEGPQYENWWLEAGQGMGKQAKTGAVGGIEMATMKVLSLEERKKLFERMPEVEDIFLHASGAALSERWGESGVLALTVPQSLGLLVRQREGDEELETEPT
ncbi:MAG: hypothetical protein MMC23_001639 [Stictis urceolatum]|nr:hypothetical protein [Stictis urceolata]